jgi:hypothetical protein
MTSSTISLVLMDDLTGLGRVCASPRQALTRGVKPRCGPPGHPKPLV